jgi:phosphoglycolate/pyridoxal phosphate phosphatase family enzyme
VVTQVIKEYRGYIFDLDGTIYLQDSLLPGARELIEGLRNQNRKVIFLSNNPTKNPQMYAEKLTKLGIPTSPDEVVNTLVAMVLWLKENAKGKKVFAIAERPLIDAIIEAGIEYSEDPAEIDIVIASYDRAFTWQKFQIAFDALWFYKRAQLVATNPDQFCPLPGGRGEVDAGPVIAALESCTGVKCETNVGKPNKLMAELVLKMTNLRADECIMVGDRLYTDIAMGHAAGMDSALVFTGETSQEMLNAASADSHPTYALESIIGLLPAK